MEIDLPPMAAVIYRCTRKFPKRKPKASKSEKPAPPASAPPSPAPPSGKKRHNRTSFSVCSWSVIRYFLCVLINPRGDE